MLVIKNEKELEKMRRAGRVHALLMEEIKKNVVPGVKTIELDKIAENYIKANGGYPSFKGYKVAGLPAFPGSICASVNNEVIHGIPGNTVLKEGDIISIDIGVYLDGYHADGARTFAVGNISPLAKKLIDVTKESFYKGIENAVHGNWLRDVSTAIQNHVEASGFSIVRDFVGHGIGEQMHEEPQIPNYRTKKRGPRLETGMTLAIEPMVNEGTYKVDSDNSTWRVVTSDGKLSAHYENTIVITENEPEILTIL